MNLLLLLLSVLKLSRSAATPGLLGRSKAVRRAFCLLGYVSLISLCLLCDVFAGYIVLYLTFHKNPE